MKKMNCAIIGCGRIGCGFDDNFSKIIKTHAGAYINNPQTNLIALCDVDKKKIKRYSKKYKIFRTYTDSDELFKNEKLDCVSICTLVETHLDLVKNAAMNGVKGIFLEKPITTNLKNAKEIIDICKKYDVTLIVDHQRRFHPAYDLVKKILEKKEVGDIQLVNVFYGSGIANTGSHMFDLLRMLFGDIKSVEGKLSKNISNNIQDPNLDVILEFDSFNCNIHSLNYKNYAVFEAEIFGTKGVLKLEMINNKVDFFKVTSKKASVFKILEPLKFKVKESKHSPIELGLQNLLQCIKMKKTPKSSAYDGYKSLEVIIAAIQSAEKKEIIRLPLKNNNYQIYSK
jgi:predicted dehydrogenase